MIVAPPQQSIELMHFGDRELDLPPIMEHLQSEPPLMEEEQPANEQSIQWNRQRHSIKKVFQTILGIGVILVIAYFQFSIIYHHEFRSARMIVQAVLVGIQSVLLYTIVIGISDIQFSSKLKVLSIFNDNSEELEMNL